MTLSTPTHEEFKNEEVHVTVHRRPPCRIELDVHASSPMIQKARRSAIKIVNKQVSVSGFRKGKAPEEIILKQYGSQVEKELHHQLADLAYVEAQKLARIPLLNNNSKISFQMKKWAEEEAELAFSFETEPQIPSIEPSQFDPKPIQRLEVSEKQIEEAIRQMLYFYAQWEPVEGRPIQDGDTIMINLETLEDDGSYQMVFNHVRFEVSKERMAEWMKRLVEGAKAGDVLEGLSEPDENATEQEKIEFKPKKVRLTLLKAEQAILPLLDDEFAKKVGAPNVEAMRQSIADLLNKKADEKVTDELREQVNHFFIENYPFDLPQSLIETEKNHRLSQLMQDQKFKTGWGQMSQEERKNVEATLEKESTQAVRLFYLSRKIVADAKLSITHKEIQDEAIATLHSLGARNTDTIPKEVYALALSKVMLAKAQDYVLAQKA